MNPRPHQSSNRNTVTRPANVNESVDVSESTSHSLARDTQRELFCDSCCRSSEARGLYFAKMIPHFTHSVAPSDWSVWHLGQGCVEDAMDSIPHTVGPSLRSDKKISGLIQTAVWGPHAECSNRPSSKAAANIYNSPSKLAR